MSLSRAAAVATAFLVTAITASAEDYWVYLGTYTGKDGSKGIYRTKLDGATGKLAAPELAAELANPSFLTITQSPVGDYALYAVGETDGKDGGGVFSFEVNRADGKLTKKGEHSSGGAGPCQVAVDGTGTWLAVANYGGGSTAVFRISALRADPLLNQVAVIQHKGSGPNPDRQKEPHAHCVAFHPKTGVLFTVDLGTDRLKAFEVRLERSADKKAVDLKPKVTESPKDDIATPPGSGPRHLAIAKDGKFGYVCGELDSTVNAVEFVGNTGKVVQSLSTLPKPTPGNSTAECILSPNGKFVYVSNRGHNSIAVFKVGEDRKLAAVGHITGDIKIPRNFNIDPSGKWMLIASQDGDKVGVWEIDPNTGLAKETGNTVKVSRPVCVKFVPVQK
jgi:6-phosphogluconolactonase